MQPGHVVHGLTQTGQACTAFAMQLVDFAIGVQPNMMGMTNPSMQPGMIPIGNQMHMAPHMGMPRSMHQMNMSGIM